MSTVEQNIDISKAISLAVYSNKLDALGFDAWGNLVNSIFYLPADHAVAVVDDDRNIKLLVTATISPDIEEMQGLWKTLMGYSQEDDYEDENQFDDCRDNENSQEPSNVQLDLELAVLAAKQKSEAQESSKTQNNLLSVTSELEQLSAIQSLIKSLENKQ